jgi:probable F420-dependent oxidoreductase
MIQEYRMKRGVLTATEQFSPEGLVEFAQALETRGYDSLWLPELFGREPIATAGYLLGRTRRICIATGIANVYVRDAHATAQARQSLAELSGGRFILGLGVSNPQLNASRGHTWQPPLRKMTAYLDAMDAVKVASPAPAQPCPTYIAAHGPQLQKLGAARTDGVITYLMTPQHTRESRQRIGPTAELNVVAMFLAERDPAIARAKARAGIKVYVGLDYYHREWRKLGFADVDFTDGGSDRLVDTLVAWGDERVLQERIAAFEAAGATRVIVMPFGVQTKSGVDLRVLDALAASR